MYAYVLVFVCMYYTYAKNVKTILCIFVPHSSTSLLFLFIFSVFLFLSMIAYMRTSAFSNRLVSYLREEGRRNIVVVWCCCFALIIFLCERVCTRRYTLYIYTRIVCASHLKHNQIKEKENCFFENANKTCRDSMLIHMYNTYTSHYIISFD